VTDVDRTGDVATVRVHTDPPGHHRPPVGRRLAVAAIVGLLAAGMTWPLAPRPPDLGGVSTGDAELAEQVGDLLGGTGSGGVAVALVADGGMTTAALGHADAAREVPLTSDTPMEIGSVTKPLTGMLLADLVDEGIVGLDQTPAELLGHDDPGLATVTLEQLASHHSGLPREATADLTGPVSFLLTGGNLYKAYDVETLVGAATGHDLAGEHDGAYSNLGFALLGQSLAAATGLSYPDLLEARLLGPLGLDDTMVATGRTEVPEGAAVGWSANGVRPAPWIGAGAAPAGVGPWSTAEDLGRLLTALIDGDAPGVGALDRRADFDEATSIGLGWLWSHTDGGDEIAFHDGGTGGFLTFVALSPSTERGVALIASTDFLMTPNSLQPVGRALLEGSDTVGESLVPGFELGGLAWILVALLVSVAPTVRLAVRRRRRRRALDRIDVAGSLLPVLVGLALARTFGAWQLLPGPWWTVAVAVGIGSVAACTVGWRAMPTTSGSRPWIRWASAGVRAAIAALLLAALLAT